MPTDTQPSTPPLTESPEFKARTAAALGGQPTSPTSFQAIGAPTSGAAATVPPRRSNSTFDVDPAAEANRVKINSTRSLLSNLIASIDTGNEQIKVVINELNGSKEGRDEAARQGFDLDVASKFLDGLTKAVDQVKPKSK